MYFTDQLNHRIRKINSSGIINTVAGSGAIGSGNGGFSGDGGQATAAQLNQPCVIAFDLIGNLYITDQNNARIRMVNSLGVINTIAGNGNYGYSGDGGQADTATFYYPNSITFDVNGNMFIADERNNVIRKVNTSGIITTVVGNGYGAFTSTGGNYSGDGGVADSCELYYPASVVFDVAGNMYISDQTNNRIRKVDTCHSSPLAIYTLTQNATPHNWSAYPSYSPNVVNAKWYWGDDSTSIGLYPSHTYDSAGWYNICVTVYNACGDTTQYCQNDSIYRLANNNTLSNMVYVNVKNSTAGINQLAVKNEQIAVYPNPSNGIIQVAVGDLQVTEIKVYDVNGKLILSQPTPNPSLEGNSITVDASSLQNGIYNVSIISNEGVVNKRIIITK